MTVEVASLLTTGRCPLNCRYCYIPKTSAMEELHQSIVRKLKDGFFLDNLAKTVGNELTHLSFWGTEPTLTLSIIQEQLEKISQLFPKLETISFSTSMMIPGPIKDFAKSLEPYRIELGIQTSLDGPAPITDKNRFPGAAQRVPENLLKLVQQLQSIKTKISFRWKATLTIDNIRWMNKNEKEIDGFFNYFKRLNAKFKKINQSSNIILKERSFVPTLAVPGRYTSEDGREFGDFLRKLRLKGYESSYSSYFHRLVDFSDELATKRRMFTCSGGDSSISVGDRLHICHRSFYLDTEQYVKSVLEERDTENWDISLFRKGTINFLKDWYMPSVGDKAARTRFSYIMAGYHDFWPLVIANTRAMTRELALVGQAEERFLYDSHYLNLFSIYINVALSCPIENLLNTGSLHIPSLSVLRMFGNGAFAELLKNFK